MLPSLVTPRLRLTPAAATDFEAFQNILTNPQVRLFLCDDKILSSNVIQNMLDDAIALAAHGLGAWMIDSGAGERIGCVGLSPAGASAIVDPELGGEVEAFVALLPHVWRRGYAAEALDAVTAYAFGPRGLTRLAATVDQPNLASHRLMARAGFERLGVHQGLAEHIVVSYRLDAKNVTKNS